MRGVSMAKSKNIPVKSPARLLNEQGEQYPGVRGKVVDFVGHKFSEGRLYIHVRFIDKTELCWQVESMLTLEEAELTNWKTGDLKHIRTFARDERDEDS